jgi:hypothetical protein
MPTSSTTNLPPTPSCPELSTTTANSLNSELRWLSPIDVNNLSFYSLSSLHSLCACLLLLPSEFTSLRSTLHIRRRKYLFCCIAEREYLPLGCLVTSYKHSSYCCVTSPAHALYSHSTCTDMKEPLPQCCCVAHALKHAHRGAAEQCLAFDKIRSLYLLWCMTP